ncbi:MAG: hypothetical protein ILN61_03555 [Lachnospiraceae bacterium]|nr:hypothetical protein [Lachnospiraceae bacterium]
MTLTIILIIVASIMLIIMQSIKRREDDEKHQRIMESMHKATEDMERVLEEAGEAE